MVYFPPCCIGEGLRENLWIQQIRMLYRLFSLEGALFVGSAMVVSLAVDDFGVFNDYIA
jgi:hypothetical protein